MSNRILIIEDDRKIADIIRLYLEQEGFQVKIALDGGSGWQLFNTEIFDLAILDLSLPTLDGLSLCRMIREQSDIYIIIVTARTNEADKLQGLEIGADDYLTKPFSPRELTARVKAYFRRYYAHQERSSQIIIDKLTIDLPRHEIFLDGHQVFLTPLEFSLLELFARRPERVFTREEIIEKVFGYDYDGLDRTVDTHVKNIRRKLTTQLSSNSFIKTVHGVGYKLAFKKDDC